MVLNLTRRDLLKASAVLTAGFLPLRRASAQIGASCGSFTPILGTGSPFSQVHLCPKYGNTLIVGGIAHVIPPGISVISGGLIWDHQNCSIDKVPGQALASNTLYYAYAWDNNGVLTADWSQTGHAEDANGIEVHATDGGRSLCGMVFTGPNGHFIGEAGQQLTLSWFNPIRVSIFSELANVATASPGLAVPANAPAPLEWLQWGVNASFIEGMDVPNVYADVTIVSDTAGASSWIAISFDGATPSPMGGPAVVKGGYHSIANVGLDVHTVALPAGSSEGHHTAQIMLTNAGNSGGAKPSATITVTSGKLYTSPLRS